MQRTNKASETINRGMTAVAMTIAIATLYSVLAPDGQISHGDTLRQQIQTVFRQRPELQITQDAQAPQESLATFVSSTSGHGYGYR